MTTYSEATVVMDIAEKTAIRKWHPHLMGASIAYLFADSISPKGGKVCLAKIRKATPVENFLNDYDLVLIVNAEYWHDLEERARLALVDHELCHVGAEISDDGTVTYRMIGHDLEEFADVVRRHGVWREDIRRFNEAQGDLFAGAEA